MKTLRVIRTSYSKDSTPLANREYRINASSPVSPVGNKREWKKYAKKHGFEVIVFEDKNGSCATELVST